MSKHTPLKIKHFFLAVLLTVVPVLKGMSQCWLSQLAKDLDGSPASSPFRSFITTDPKGFDAYKIFVTAKGLSAGLRSDAEILKYISALKQDAKFLQSIGDEAGLIKFIGAIPEGADVAKVLKTWQQIFTDYQDLYAAISKFTDAERIKFLGDFADNAASLAALNKDSGLANAWKILSNGAASLRRKIDNINAVQAFKAANPQIADDAIQAAFDGLKDTRQGAFIKALQSCADNKDLIGSLKKSRLATVDEIKDALNKMRNYKTGKPQVGNLGFLEGNIPGVNIEDKMWATIGKEDALYEPRIFDAIEVTGTTGTWLRTTDSEYRMLNDLAQKLGGVRGKKFPEITGTLKIVSDNPYCKSCQGVIQQFSDMFPNIEITLIDGVK